MSPTPSSELTARQREVLSFVRDHQRHHGHPPTTREIQAHFGFASQTAAVDHLRALARKGALQHHAGKARGHLPALAAALRTSLLEIPLYGTIPAGLPPPPNRSPTATSPSTPPRSASPPAPAFSPSVSAAIP